ncbi:MAG: hypothetical protein BAJALOKI3v1_90036 [Promethearchaeota archaeon]|nr:MAG: hypothetical protein BAJALOKI3v1_90036 [Candidatus Lokiarchaeota archaeon]
MSKSDLEIIIIENVRIDGEYYPYYPLINLEYAEETLGSRISRKIKELAKSIFRAFSYYNKTSVRAKYGSTDEKDEKEDGEK